MLEYLLKIGAFCLGFFILVRGADYLVDYSVFIAKRFKLPDAFVGIAILSVGTSLPEFSTSLYALYSLPEQQASSFIISNVLGSNISNIGMVFATALLFYKFVMPESFFKKELPLLLLAVFIFFFFAYNNYFFSSSNNPIYGQLNISRLEGIGLLLIMSFYLFFSYREAGNSESAPSSFPNYFYKPLGLLFFLLALLSIYFGSRWIVDGAFFIAVDVLGINEKIIVITLVAFGTSLPELATSVVTLKKKQYGLFMGNIMGSNMFNILFVVGLAATLVPLKFVSPNLPGSSLLDFGWFLFILLLLLFAATLQKKVMDKKSAMVLFLGYGFFVYYLLKI